MATSAKKNLTFRDALPGGTRQRPSSENPTERGPTASTPSQILLEALQNFVIPLIHTAGGENKKDTGQVHSMGPEAVKLLAALQEFVSSMIVHSRFSQPRAIEVVLEDDAKSPSAATPADSLASEVKLSAEEIALNARIKQMYPTIMKRIPEAVREHVFSKMPIRVLHFTNVPGDSGSKLQITLLDRNEVCDRIIKDIHAKPSFVKRQIQESVAKRYNRYQRFGDSELFLTAEKSITRESTKYAILSHTWLRGTDSEITYGDWQTGQFDTQKPGYRKLANFCRSAWKDHGLSFGWMDTVCINKDSSSELDESIRSMYKWYKNSHICITYLAETSALGDIHRDPWFTRGWTFQELLAPGCMTFYNWDWKKFVPYTHLGDKHDPDIIAQISKATTITVNELCFSTDLPISRKMQLAAKRKVMREEDTAYSLMGICNVSISIAYGEGAERAFFRLITEILNTSSKVVDIFNCAQKERLERASIIPSGPSAYLQCSKDIMRARQHPPIEPLLLTHAGLRTPILLMPSLQEDDPCLKRDPIGKYYATFQLSESPYTFGPRSPSHLLDKGITKSAALHRWTFGILNFGGDTTNIHVPGLCLAVCFRMDCYDGRADWGSTSSFDQMVTDKPIVFRLKKQGLSWRQTLFSIKRSDLGKHGMILKTMYL